MKKTISLFLLVLQLFLITPTFAEENAFEAKKAAVRIANAGDVIECVISAGERSLFSYRAQLVYDKELLEFESADPVYIHGEGQPIIYTPGEQPKEVSYNVPGSLVYTIDGTRTGYYGEDNTPGIYRSISTIMGYEGRTEGNEILRVCFKAKAAGDCFIYLMDEQTAVLNEDRTVTNNTVTTDFIVKNGGTEAKAARITDMSDIAYSWRKTEAVFQQVNASTNEKTGILEGTHYDISYTNPNISLEVLSDGTIICTIPMDKGDAYTPIVARVTAFGEYKRTTCVKYDATQKILKFVIDDFGDYIVADTSYQISDCTKDSGVYQAVSYLKSIGVVDEDTAYFEPDRSITKAEFVKMLMCSIGNVDVNALVWFDDVSLMDWHYKYIATAVKKGVITESEGMFYPDMPIQADEAEQMLKNALVLINGSDAITFNKAGMISRGEAAVAMQNMLCNKLN